MYFETKFRRYFEVMPWLIQYMSLLFPLGMCMVTVVETEKKVEIYWNSSNPLFRSQDRYLSVEPSIKLTFICPQYSMEYYVVYMVPEAYYNSCIIEDVSFPKVRLIVNCSDPTADPPISFSIWVKQFQPIPGMPDFTFLKRYYFTTTSTGILSEMNNQVYGACKNKNMSMVLEMCCTTTTATIRQITPIPPSTQSSTTKRPVTEKPTTLPPAPVPTTTTTTSMTSATRKTIRTRKLDFPKPDTDIVINATDENANTELIDISATRTLDTSWLVLLLTLLCQLLVLLHR